MRGPRAACAALVLWAGLGRGAGAAPARLQALPEPVPVVLVHGITSDARRTWGWGEPGDRRAPRLYHRLLDAGYRPGRTLFAAGYAPGADLDRAARALARAVREAARGPAGAVDVVTHSSGALVLRYALDAGWLEGVRVRRALLLAPVERGSALAEQVHRLALRQRALTRLRQAGGAAAGDWSEADYVAHRARTVYGPLYGRFLAEARFGVRPSAPLPLGDFEAWLARRGGEAARALADPRPPRGLAEPPRPGAAAAPPPGTDLSRAYYERVAVAVARDARRLLVPWQEALWRDWWQDLPAEGDARSRLLAFLRRRLGRLLGRWLESAIRDEAMEQALAHLAFDPTGPAVRRLVRERSGDHVANAWLAAWNARARDPGAPLRVAAAVFPAGVPVPGVGPHDGFVELEATRLPAGAGPGVVLRGLRAPLHHRTADHPEVQRQALAHLAAPEAGEPARRPAVGRHGEPAAGVPVVYVVRRSRLTTDRKPRTGVHAGWRFDFGDGTAWVDDDPGCVAVRVRHAFTRAGTHTVRAAAYGPDGEVLLTRTWRVRVTRPGEVHTFHARSLAPPRVHLTLEGPRAWLVGRPAPYRLRARVEPPPEAEVVEVRYHPGERFQVVWRRPGDGFPVRGAVSVRLRYRLPGGGGRTESFTFVTERRVDVAALGLVGP